MRILVTGASGFIGSHLVERLVKEKHEVTALVRESELKKVPEDKKDGLNLLKKLNVNIIKGNLLYKESLKKAVKNVEIVFHLAAIARPMAIPKQVYFDVNEKGTENLLEVCRENKKIKKIVIMSSISAIGPSRNGKPVNEKTTEKPIDIYGWSKLAQEKTALNFFKKYKLPIIFLNPTMVFGPRDFEMLKLFRAVNKRFFPVKSDVKGIGYLYVENLVEACILAMKKGKNGEKYLINNGESYSINEIVSEIARCENKKILPFSFPKWIFVLSGRIIEITARLFGFHPMFKHDTVEWMTGKFWYADISKAKKELGYNPKISLREGIQKTTDYYNKKEYL